MTDRRLTCYTLWTSGIKCSETRQSIFFAHVLPEIRIPDRLSTCIAHVLLVLRISGVTCYSLWTSGEQCADKNPNSYSSYTSSMQGADTCLSSNTPCTSGIQRSKIFPTFNTLCTSGKEWGNTCLTSYIAHQPLVYSEQIAARLSIPNVLPV